MKFTIKWLPDYKAWGVCAYNERIRRGFIPAYYCNTPDDKELAQAHADRLACEYQAELPL